ncbi:cory-CC-star protein [Marinospirillum sp.]|uniref:cory-CC-star protein n=1 Tax=Marinospirillum sp. TaxID=2183934 RepID=UPI003A859965
MTRENALPSRAEKIRAWLSQARFFAEEAYSSRYRGALARARRDEDDLFMLLVFSEMMGIQNPASYYTLELQPLLLERFHDWHCRQGLEQSPLDHFRCC